MTEPRPDILEHNVSTLLERRSREDQDDLREREALETGGARPRIAPRIAPEARARIRAELVAAHGVARVRARWPLAVGLGAVAAAAAAVVIVGGLVGSEPRPAGGEGFAGAEVTRAPGAVVTELAPRRLRVEGAALIDVAPGNGAFVVETAHGRIEVLGTRFLVDGERDRTTAAVVRGEVKLASDRGEVVLRAGEQGVAEPGRAPVRGPAPRLSHLVSWARVARHRAENAAVPVRRGALIARDPVMPGLSGAEYALPIVRLALDVVVEDQVARVALDQTFHNAASQTLEGVYRFAVPPDAALQRLAMYVDGKLTESAVVERMAARRIYEELVYRRVDPALLEWAGTGRVSLRVYPIPAHQDKRLMLAYTQSLPRLYDDWTLAIPMPEVDQPVGAMDVSVRVKGCANCELSSPSHRIAVARQGDDAVVTYHRAAETIGDSFVVRVRDPRRGVTVARSELGGERYVMVRAPGELAGGRAQVRPRTWVILDDVSASRDELELRAQADIIDAFLRELDEQDRVAVIAFDVAARTVLPATRVLDVDRRAVRRALDGEGGVGATDAGAAFDAAMAQLAGVDRDAAMIVYLGDGVITSGARNLDALRAWIAGKAQFIGVGVGDGPDTQTLQGLAAATGGYATTIDLADDLAWRAFDLVAALHTPRVTGLEARLVDAAGKLVPSTAYLGAPQLAAGEEIDLVAKLAGGGAPAAVELSGTLDGAPWRRTIALDGSVRPSAGYLPRLWAQRHIAARLLAKHEPVHPCPVPAPPRVSACPTPAELREQRDEAIRNEVVALGKRYFLLSRHTSLLVLENDEMYARYGVAKGAGDTWAPYAMPSTIPVVAATSRNAPASAAPAAADDAELVRTPVQVFTGGGDDIGTALGQRNAGVAGRRGARDGEIEPPPTIAVRADGPSPWGAERSVVRGEVSGASAAVDNQTEDPRDPFATHAPRPVGKSGGHRVRTIVKKGSFDDGEWDGAGLIGRKGNDFLWMSHLSRLSRYAAPSDHVFDDATALVPALFPDATDQWRAVLAAGGDTAHTIDDAARALLAEARRRLPAGLYRWGDLELAVDLARRIGWRRTTGAGLTETASFDGATWIRRYAELGLDVARAVGDDDIALALAVLPLWIAEPSHYARWFDVTARGRDVVLSRKVRGAARELLVLRFDDGARLVAIIGAGGEKLVEVSWSVGPVRARILGDDIAVAYTGLPLLDATRWAHRDAATGVTVELPARGAAYWERALAAETAGTPAWRRAERQLMVALAAAADRPGLWRAYERMRAHGVELGDLALASAGVATVPTDAQFADEVAPFAGHPLARYLTAGRAYRNSHRPERLVPALRDGFVGALWSLRAATAYAADGRGKEAAAEVAAIGERAPELRLIGAAGLAERFEIDVASAMRAWDAAAVGEYRNLARAAAAQTLSARGDVNAAVERVQQLLADLDLRALSPPLRNLSIAIEYARSPAGWQTIWSAWRDRVLAGGSYDHVMAALDRAPDSGARSLLERAAQLADGNPARQLDVARAAFYRGHRALADSVVAALRKMYRTREFFTVAAYFELHQERFAEALDDLEAAQAAGADEAVSLTTVRVEMVQLFTTAVQLAKQTTARSSGPDAARAVQRAVAWGQRWRAVDPDNTEIDRQLGEVMRAAGDSTAEWRYLSTAIERAPWSSAGYVTVADELERQDRFAEALAFWQQAIVVDQTNPTLRFRAASALIRLGRPVEAEPLLDEIVRRKWHAQWALVVTQAKDLLAQIRVR
jgi:hypothetical protein